MNHLIEFVPWTRHAPCSLFALEKMGEKDGAGVPLLNVAF